MKSLWLITADEILAVVKKSYLFAKHFCVVLSRGITKPFLMKLISQHHCKWKSAITLAIFETVAWGYAGGISWRAWRVLAETLTSPWSPQRQAWPALWFTGHSCKSDGKGDFSRIPWDRICPSLGLSIRGAPQHPSPMYNSGQVENWIQSGYLVVNWAIK